MTARITHSPVSQFISSKAHIERIPGYQDKLGESQPLCICQKPKTCLLCSLVRIFSSRPLIHQAGCSSYCSFVASLAANHKNTTTNKNVDSSVPEEGAAPWLALQPHQDLVPLHAGRWPGRLQPGGLWGLGCGVSCWVCYGGGASSNWEAGRTRACTAAAYSTHSQC